jgi:hypothetical protein
MIDRKLASLRPMLFRSLVRQRMQIAFCSGVVGGATAQADNLLPAFLFLLLALYAENKLNRKDFIDD